MFQSRRPITPVEGFYPMPGLFSLKNRPADLRHFPQQYFANISATGVLHRTRDESDSYPNNVNACTNGVQGTVAWRRRTGTFLRMLKSNGHQKKRRSNEQRKPNGEPKLRWTRTQAPDQVLLTVAKEAPILDRHVCLPLVYCIVYQGCKLTD